MNKVFKKIIEKLEEEKMSYFLTIANTGDEKLDCAYEHTGDALDKAIEIVKQEAADYNKGITDYLEKLNELEKQYTEQYGCEIIEMYADVVRDFKEWLAELID